MTTPGPVPPPRTSSRSNSVSLARTPSQIEKFGPPPPFKPAPPPPSKPDPNDENRVNNHQSKAELIRQTSEPMMKNTLPRAEKGKTTQLQPDKTSTLRKQQTDPCFAQNHYVDDTPPSSTIDRKNTIGSLGAMLRKKKEQENASLNDSRRITVSWSSSTDSVNICMGPVCSDPECELQPNIHTTDKHNKLLDVQSLCSEGHYAMPPAFLPDTQSLPSSPRRKNTPGYTAPSQINSGSKKLLSCEVSSYNDSCYNSIYTGSSGPSLGSSGPSVGSSGPSVGGYGSPGGYGDSIGGYVIRPRGPPSSSGHGSLSDYPQNKTKEKPRNVREFDTDKFKETVFQPDVPPRFLDKDISRKSVSLIEYRESKSVKKKDPLGFLGSGKGKEKIKKEKFNNVSSSDAASLKKWVSPMSHQPYQVPSAESAQVKQYLAALPEDKRPVNTLGVQWRIKQLQTQLPRYDHNINYCHEMSQEEQEELFMFVENRKEKAQGQGEVKAFRKKDKKKCEACGGLIDVGIIADKVPGKAWHPGCFQCNTCSEILVDLIYFQHEGLLHCGRHHAELLRPRCHACDELIFGYEFITADNHEYHKEHFCCWECDTSLGGTRYVSHKGQPYCQVCYEKLFCQRCVSCKEPIGVGMPVYKHGPLRWHGNPSCYACSFCKRSLVNRTFMPTERYVYCSKNCYRCHDSLRKTKGK